MSTWLWVAVGVGAFLFLSAVVSLAVAAVLGRIAQETTELLEGEFWSTASLTREKIRKEQEAPTERQAAAGQLGARRSHW
jgi:hypothetical protein